MCSKSIVDLFAIRYLLFLSLTSNELQYSYPISFLWLRNLSFYSEIFVYNRKNIIYPVERIVPKLYFYKTAPLCS